MAFDGTSIVAPGGMYWPLDRVMPLMTLRVNEAGPISNYNDGMDHGCILIPGE